MNAVLLEQTTSHLTRQVRRWDRRLRAVESLVWVPRGLILGLIAGVVVALIARMRPWLLPEQVAGIAAVAVALGVAGALAAVWVWPRSTAKVARHFDRRFALRERISTALELAAGVIPYPDHLAEWQLSDATRAAQSVDVSAVLPARVRWREIALVVLLGALLAYLLLADNPQADELRAERAVQQAIANQAAQVEEMIETIRENPELSAEEQAALTAPLGEALDILQQPDITQQEAVAALAEAQQSLRELGDGMMADQAAAYQEAASALAGSDRTSDLARALNRPDLGQSADALDALADDLGESDLSAEEREDLANRLDEAADALEQNNPALAERLRQAADALRRGDTEAAQQALREAAETLREQQRQLEQSEMAQSAQSASQQMREGQQELAQAGQDVTEQPAGDTGESAQQPQQQAGQQGQQEAGQPQGAEGQPQQAGQSPSGEEGQKQAGQSGAEEGQQPGAGQQAGQTGQGEPSEQGAEGAQMSQGASEGGEQPGGEAGASGDVQAGGADQQAGQPSEGDVAVEGEVQGQVDAPGAGEGAGGAGADVTSGEVDPQIEGEISTDNSPGGADGAIEAYEGVYDPSTIGGAVGETLDVGGQTDDSGGEPVQEGEFGPNPAGESSLSYSSVYGNYQGIVSDALDSGRIPLDQRDVIHDYFSSLEP